MNNAFVRVIGEATQTGTWECTSEKDMIAALEAAEDMVSSLQNALQGCVSAMTGVLDVDAGLSIQWMVLRRARENAQRVVTDGCKD
jgi:hypothetical protein